MGRRYPIQTPLARPALPAPPVSPTSGYAVCPNANRGGNVASNGNFPLSYQTLPPTPPPASSTSPRGAGRAPAGCTDIFGPYHVPCARSPGWAKVGDFLYIYGPGVERGIRRRRVYNRRYWMSAPRRGWRRGPISEQCRSTVSTPYSILITHRSFRRVDFAPPTGAGKSCARPGLRADSMAVRDKASDSPTHLVEVRGRKLGTPNVALHDAKPPPASASPAGTGGRMRPSVSNNAGGVATFT